LGSKAVCVGMGTIYKSAGDQPATVSRRLQWIVEVWNVDHLFTILLCFVLIHCFLRFWCLQVT